ncbi:cupin-like protein [Marinimicrobium koreense]|uniref:Cupin-like protein n=1 Tax=Marinimicrobium koreense TaxID=306545 RepID=A0A3N1P0X1_9GAMM|nr:cupin-like domain-containing protein [Marinimicrobium koreense]ROQ21689.1 cupin-like protein [Marinimicrobium koreense]
MVTIATKTAVITDCSSESLDESVIASKKPVIIKGLVKHWKLVDEGRQSDSSAIRYLNSYYNGRPSFACIGPPEIQGRYFYNDNRTQLNYDIKKTTIDEVLDLIEKGFEEENPTSYYIASNVIDTHFPGFRAENDIAIPRPDLGYPIEDVRASIWIGNRTTACCHYDASDNLACCTVGKRRFTLFPPDQIANLYPGPLTPTPGGQALSMVDFDNPDFEQYPNFAEAIEHGQVADLEPGDALYLPSMWWHQVESKSRFNVLINYWWSDSAKHMGPAMNVLYHALLSLRDKPEHEKQAWKHIFDYYIFGDPDRAGAHLPEEARGYLGEIDSAKARMLRALLLNKLNR